MKKIYLLIFLFLFAKKFSFSQVKPDSGLVAYYPFNGNANDVSGNGNNAVFNNATLTNDKIGNPNSAYHFNGIDNYIQIPNSPSINLSNQISLCVYIRPTGFYKGPCHGNSILMKGDDDYLPGNYALRFDDNAYTFGNNCRNSVVDTIHQNFYGVSARTPSPGYSPYVNKNQWYCVVFTYDGDTAKFYVDGYLQYTQAQTGLTFSNNYDLFFGKLNNATFPYWLNGDLDEVRIYNRAISDQEVEALCPAASPLAVTLTRFETNVSNKQISLNWNVSDENGVESYSIQRSLTGYSNFKEIGKMKANKAGAYSFIDKTALVNQTYYYRLMIFEKTNVISYSAIKTAGLFNKNKLVIVYPNPSRGNLTVKVNGYTGKVKFSLINTSGQVVFTKSDVLINNNETKLTFNNLKGMYWLRVSTANDSMTQKIVLY